MKFNIFVYMTGLLHVEFKMKLDTALDPDKPYDRIMLRFNQTHADYLEKE